jgi:hypothetical protein
MTAFEFFARNAYTPELEVWIDVIAAQGPYDYVDMDIDIDTATDVCIDYKTGLLKVT